MARSVFGVGCAMTGPTAVRPAGSPTTRPGTAKGLAGAVVIVAAATVIFVGLSRLVAPPTFVDRLTFVNPTEYDLDVEVTDSERKGWLAVGTARKNQATTMEDTIDQGEVWIFRFAAQGQDGGELRMSRSQLERDSWTVQIPAQISATLRAQGAPATP